MSRRYSVVLLSVCMGCDAAESMFISTTVVDTNDDGTTVVYDPDIKADCDTTIAGITDTTAMIPDSLSSEEFAWEEDEWYTPLDSQTVPLILIPTLTYDAWRSYILVRRDSLKRDYENANSDSARNAVLEKAEQVLLVNLVNGIIPHWYGTPWDFNGHTAVPGEGEIACGYFVSTTLLHAGFNLNRYKLAQQSAYNEIKTLQTTGSIHKLINKEVSDLIELAHSTLKEGLYVIGLDFHVGYLLKWKGEVYFVHSNYLYPGEVIVELAQSSLALMGSASYYVGEVSSNKALLKKWLYNTPIPIVMD